MRFLLQRKFTVIPLLLYWPAIFILMHISFPQNLKIHTSDKTLHFLVYLILVFLLWFAISPTRKVNWRKATAWCALLVLIAYAAADEWFQRYVNRSPEMMDFWADMAASLTGLVLLSIFPFWPTSLVLTAGVIFVVTNLMQSSLASQLPLTNIAFHLFAYAFFTLLWVQNLAQLVPVRPPQPRWLIGAAFLPVCLLIGIESFTAIAGGGFKFLQLLISLAGITAVIATITLAALFRWHFSKNANLGRLKRRV